MALPTADVALEVATFGRGAPVTVFAHGLAGSIADTRPIASGVPGTRAFFHFRGHGRSVVRRPDPAWGYAALAADLRAVADAVGATRAVGVSMGGGALLRLLADTPGRFARLVFFLPSMLDRPRDGPAAAHYAALAERVEAGDRDGVEELLRTELPPELRDLPDATRWAAGRTVALLGGEAAAGPHGATGRLATGRLLRTLPSATPLCSRGVLRAVHAPALVLAQERDPLHPVAAARELAAALPAARLVVFERGAVLWTDRRRLRHEIVSFLGA